MNFRDVKKHSLLVRSGAIWAISGLLLSGCAVLVPQKAPAVFDLTLSDTIAAVPGNTRSQIFIANPKVINSLNNDRIVIKPNPAQITFFSDVRWADTLPKLVQLYLSRAFASTDGARGVGLPGDGLLIDHQILLDVSSFQVEVRGSSSVAVVEIAVRILNDKNGRVIASRTFSNEVVTTDDAVASVRSLNEALELVTANLIEWVYQEI